MVRLLLSNVDATSNQAQFLALEIHFVQLICTRVMVPKSRFYGLIKSVIQVMSIASSQHPGGQYDRGAVFQKLRSDEKMPWGHPPRLRPWHRHCSREVFGYTVMGSLWIFLGAPSPFSPLATGLTSASPPDISPTSQLKWPSTYRHPRINLVYLTSQSILILLNESIAMLTGSMFSMDLTKSYVCKWVKVTFTMGYVQNSNIILVLKGSNSSQPIMLLDLGHVIWKWQPESMVQRENIFHI